MKNKLMVVVVFLVAISLSIFAFMIIEHPKSGEVISSFTDCGCGSCGGESTKIEDIKNSAEGKLRYDTLKKKSETFKSTSSACATVGCSICVEYRLIES